MKAQYTRLSTPLWQAKLLGNFKSKRKSSRSISLDYLASKVSNFPRPPAYPTNQGLYDMKINRPANAFGPIPALFAFSLLSCTLLSKEDRTAPPKDLNGFSPFAPPATSQEWANRAEELKLRLLVANGLWPMPGKTPLNPVIHGKVKRPGFTVEKVYFESVPGFFVTGLLFRPETPKPGKLPAVLSPHGHGGRLHDLGKEGVRRQIVIGAERFEESGRMPKIARCATLARLGCVTFLYDMIGYADNRQISYQLAHRFAKQRPDFEGPDSWGFFSAQAELRLQSIFGLQTWNSIRALDFLASLPDVDPKRIGVTGNSGGGTQTIILGALDPRPIVSFPNGMVSSSMQGGCTCENASLLRIGTGNVELAALFAPKPLGMTSADDWTREMLVPGKGFPEIKKLYTLLGKPNNTTCPDLTHFKHNYNYVSRAVMYSWFNRHMKLGHKDPIVEEDFKLLSAKEHAVWDEEHPEPPSGEKLERKLTKWLAGRDGSLLNNLPADQKKTVFKKAWETIIGRKYDESTNFTHKKRQLINLQTDEQILLEPINASSESDSITIWLGFADGDKEIKGLAKGKDVHYLVRVFMEGKDGPARTVANKREFAGYTHGFNHSRFARQVHDLLSVISYVRQTHGKAPVIRATGRMQAQAMVAAYLAGSSVAEVKTGKSDFTFSSITDYRDPKFLPGAVKYGDVAWLRQALGKRLAVK
jgi:dienelactone hydrolase